MRTYKKAVVIDLFCGVGGLTHGFTLEDFNVVAGFDSDSTCKYAYESNNGKAKFICQDIRETNADDISPLYPENSIKILIGCAPCQSFSRYTSGNRGKNDEKWSLLIEFVRIIKETQPDIISMENVPQLAKYDKKGVYNIFLEVLKQNNYYISDPKKIVYCPEYGVPQNRKRLVVLASKRAPIEMIPPIYNRDNFPSVRDAIGSLPPIADGEINKEDPLHRSQRLSDLNKKRIKSIQEGGSWREWSEELKLECHKKLTGSTFSDVYGRMIWAEPSPTLTTHCIGLSNGRFGHPDQDRAISLREAAILQSFPPSYKLADFSINNKLVSANIQRHIGNAVPVKLGQAIAISIKHHINQFFN